MEVKNISNKSKYSMILSIFLTILVSTVVFSYTFQYLLGDLNHKTMVQKAYEGVVFKIGSVLGTSDTKESTFSVQKEPEKEKESVFAKNLAPIYEKPTRIYFDEVDIDIPLISVGVNDNGQLDNPKEWSVGGWYKHSPRPGERGNIIVNAHYDDNRGAPAAFWELKNVSIGDKVFLVDALGKIYTYHVVDSFYIDIQDPNRLRIFDSDEGKSELTLITCGGVWSPLAGTYSKRLVVKAYLDLNAKTAFVPSN